jgi:hypothetical protein
MALKWGKPQEDSENANANADGDGDDDDDGGKGGQGDQGGHGPVPPKSDAKGGPADNGDDSKKKGLSKSADKPSSKQDADDVKGDGDQVEDDGLGSDPWGGGKGAQGNDQGDLDGEAKRSADDIGDDFRKVIDEAAKNSLLDPNKKNSENAAKLVHALNNMSDEFPQRLDKNAQKRYDQWKAGPMKPPKKGMPNKELPQLQVGNKRVHKVDMGQHVVIKPPQMPEI